MKKSRLEMLRCPKCKDKLDLIEEISDVGNITKGNLVCEKCRETYQIRNGTPILYVPDDEAIARSKRTEFDEFVITNDRLSALSERNIPKNRLGVLSNRIFSLFFVLSGWFLIFATCLFLLYKAVKGGLSVDSKPLSFAFIILVISTLFFVIDYIIHRIEAKDRYETQLQKIVQLTKASKLSEYDSRLQIKDKKECYGNINVAPTPKAQEIASTLKKYDFPGGEGLNIGCGGELHRWVSKPYFDQGYEMLGIDISEEYLAEYRRIFKTDGLLANSISLPLKNDTFDLINYTDILEHLHHPFLGLCEANRVLKNGGRIILATPYRCRLSPRGVNPLIFIEAAISLYYDNILGPRMMLSGFQDMEYYHLEFSKNEITNMLESAGFTVSSFDTYFAKSKMLTKIFSKLPLLRLMGGSIMVIGVKQSGNGKQTY